MKKDYFFTFKDQNSNSFGLKVKSWNYLNSPERKFEEIEVPGKNGSVFVDEKCYKNRIIDIVCLIDLRGQDESTVGTKLNEWLINNKEYGQLKISDDTEHYFEATCINKLDFTEIINHYYEVLISFSAKPFKKDIHNEPITVLPGETVEIYNDSAIESEPIIHVYLKRGETVSSININNDTYTFRNHPGTEFIIDSPKMHMYKDTDGLIENYAEYYVSDDFPVLYPGINKVSLNGAHFTKVVIYPNLQYL